MSSVTLTPEQQVAADGAVDFLMSRAAGFRSIGGYAGTGKTTVISDVCRRTGEAGLATAVCAFTGKAASVLRKKGVSAGTIHSLIYVPTPDPRGRVSFVLKADIPYDCIIVDEASMVSAQLWSDLLSFRKPILLVGDIGQLEPIGDNPKLLAKPTWRLEQVHRQAESSPIIRFATAARRGSRLPRSCPPELLVGRRGDFIDAMLDVDQCVCGYNATRHRFNSAFRDHYGYRNVLNVGDKVICLRNNRKLGLFNGMMGRITGVGDVYRDMVVASVLGDDGVERSRLPMALCAFGGEVPDTPQPGMTYWDYGYVVTCHKAQGSEWDSVAVLEEISSSWDARRWVYTAATRASERLVYCHGG